MKLGIMQPYFLPYIGYFQLINTVDKFVIYDDLQYTKKGWINRNKILSQNATAYISLPIQKDTHLKSIRDRYLSNQWPKERIKILARVKNVYSSAEYFDDAFSVVEKILNVESDNLFEFNLNSIEEVCNYLEIKTELIVSSSLNIDKELSGESRVIEICNILNTTTYINPIGGKELYSQQNFLAHKIQLMFLKSNLIKYQQFGNDFFANLSILDLMMFCSKNTIRLFLDENFSIE